MTDTARIVLSAIIGMACATAAQAQASLRVELRVQNDFDVRLADRVRGQTSDLPIEVSTYTPAFAAPSMAAATAQALAHCRESHADVVVWMPRRTANAWQLAVATCKDQRLLVRRIDAARPALSDATASPSGALETAALLLRAVLSVLAHGGSVGAPIASPPPDQPPPMAATTSAAISDERATEFEAQNHESTTDIEPVRELAQASVRAARDRPEDDEDPPRQTPSPAPDLVAMLGWQQTWENARRALSQPALAGAFALGGARLKAGLAASFGFGNSYADAHTSLRIARHTLAAQARLNLLQFVGASITTGVELGAVVYSRSTLALDPRASATASAMFMEPLLTAWLSAATHLGPLWIALSAGFEALPWTPRFVYLRADGGEQRAIPIWPVAPRVTLSLALGSP